MVRAGEQNSDRARYFKPLFADIFNSATALCYWTERPRNDSSKTEDFQGESRLENFAYCVDWARAAGLTVKGHPLFWPIPKAVPEWLKRYDYATQMKFLEVRVRSLVARFRGRVSIWDAVNESLWEPAFRNLPSRRWPHLDSIQEIADYVEPVLRWARECDVGKASCRLWPSSGCSAKSASLGCQPGVRNPRGRAPGRNAEVVRIYAGSSRRDLAGCGNRRDISLSARNSKLSWLTSGAYAPRARSLPRRRDMPGWPPRKPPGSFPSLRPANR